MNKQKWIILVLALAMIGSAAVTLQRLKSHQRLGKPGIKATAIAGSPRMDIYLPEQVLNYQSELVPMDPGLFVGLPPDTSFIQRRYTPPDNEANQLLLNVVLMGTDRTSIHKPQFCLKGSGWDIDDAVSAKGTVSISEPRPYDLPVMKLLTSRQIPYKGEVRTRRGVYVYWFVADDDLTADHLTRMRKSATHLLRTGELERWAYVFCFATCWPGEEDATFERIQKFLAASVPEFQLTAGHGSPVQNTAQIVPRP
jgi:hypothetical protein